VIAVIFEVEGHDQQKQTYFDLAADLKPVLETIDGFISVERFESLHNPGKILSLSFWRDEESLRTWRHIEKHRSAQSVGRKRVFKEYRLSVAQVQRQYGLNDRADAPKDSLEYHDQTELDQSAP